MVFSMLLPGIEPIFDVTGVIRIHIDVCAPIARDDARE
jgi:hypothetical protein